jgi:hypothetical protein
MGALKGIFYRGLYEGAILPLGFHVISAVYAVDTSIVEFARSLLLSVVAQYSAFLLSVQYAWNFAQHDGKWSAHEPT